ncbi:MAG TPA: amino acid ABC transporter permease [Acidimicrobiia bacterium]|nr:amino acid ABC transporter permease [Acidimicrobiia bacterium]
MIDFSWDVVTENLDLYWQGLQITVFVVVVSFAISTVLGVVVALLRLSDNPIIRPLMAAYVNIFRAIPMLVFILFVYYGLAIAFNMRFLSAIAAGMVALCVQYSAWLGEIFRAGIQAVPKGQREASSSVGMTSVGTFFSVILPQATRIVIPPTGNMLIGMVKDSSLLYIIGVAELLRVTNTLANRTFRYFEVYLALVLIYLALTTLIYYGVKYLERRFTEVDVLTQTKPLRSFRQRRRTARLRELQEAVLAESAEKQAMGHRSVSGP